MVRSTWGVSLARILAVLEVGAAAAACGGRAETAEDSPPGDPSLSGGATAEGTGGAPELGTGGALELGTGGAFDSSGGTGPRFPIDREEFEGFADPYLLDALVSYDPEVLSRLCTSAEPDAYLWYYECLDLVDRDANCEDVFSFDDARVLYGCGLQSVADEACGPARHSGSPYDQCCYFVGGDCPIGRPFLVDSVARTAEASARSDWIEDVCPDLSELDEPTRAALAQFYLEEGLSEHASVAAFSRFVLQCLAHGAPADIVEGAVRACQEEVEHAKCAFALASHYAAEPRGPGPLEIKGALAEPQDLTSVVLSAVREGCVGETISAHLIAAARDAATDPVVKARLAVIAEQELEHALLAYRFVAWALASASRSGEAGGRLSAAIESAFLDAAKWVGFGPILEEAEAGNLNREQLRAHGYLEVSERRELAQAALNQVVRPAAAALLRARAQRPRHHAPHWDSTRLV